MRRTVTLLACVLALPGFAFAAEQPAAPSADCTCAAAFNQAVTTVEADYAGYLLKVGAHRRESYDRFKALLQADAAGADCVMIGALLAGTDEAPGETYLYQGRTYKAYRGMGSVGAMARGSADRYFQQEVKDTLKLVPECIEGQVPYKGPVDGVLHQLVGGLRAGMGYVGAANLKALRERARFLRVTSAAVHESHPHGVGITREAPNYQRNV